MTVKTNELIELNNQKREELSEENEQYYEKILIHIRTHLSISEQHGEELLIEILDHLLEAQANGKRAEEVFGDHPVAYCNELIKQLPKEKKRNMVSFVWQMIVQFFGVFVLVTGILRTVISFFVDIDQTIFLGTTLISFIITGGCIFLAVWFILFTIRQSVHKKHGKVKQFLITMFLVGGAFSGSIFLPRLVPSFGYAVEVSGYVYLIVGAVILLVIKLLKVRQSSTS